VHRDEDRWDPEKGVFDPALADEAEIVVHLAGEPIAAGRWSPEQKRKILDSRVRGTRALAEALAARTEPPRVLICASAVGYYGNRGEEELSEGSPAGTGFLAEVTRAWEEAAEPARAAGIRVVHARLGVVLSTEGGALAKMLPVFRLGLGGRLGDGKAWMSWIHLEDAARALWHLMHDANLSGPVNLCSPQPVRNREFTRELARALHRPAILPVPGTAIRALLGEMGTQLLLGSVCAHPEKLRSGTFQFRHPELPDALANLLGG